FGRKTMHIFKSSNYRLTKAVNYQPSTEVASSPMIKITASSVTVDLNGFVVSRQDTDVNGASCPNAVGIEIGYSPYDAAQGKFGLSAGAVFANAAQPENVTIRNGVLDNFGIGIVIHAGVKNVVLEDLTITRSALGVVCAGQTAKQVASITLKNVTITGDGTNRSTILAWAKAKLENTTDTSNGYMKYSAESIMPQQQDPISGGDSDNNVYSGVLLVYTNTATLENVVCNNLGEETAVNTFTFPVYARNSSNLLFKDVIVSGSKSDSMVAGIVCDTCSFVTMNNIISTNNNNTNTATTMGLYFKGAATNISIDGAQVNNNSGTVAYGLHMTALNGVTVKNITATGNAATGGQCFGVYAATSAANVIVDGANVSNNTGTTTVGGMYLATADSVQLKNITANNNGGALNGIAIGIQCGGIASDVLLENIVASGNTGSAPETAGAGGIFFAGTNSGLTFKNVVATNNIVTAATPNSYAYGIKMNSGRALTFEDINCSYNVGPNATQSTNDSDAGDWNTVSCAGIWLVIQHLLR
ncbi:hypothetical protein EBQ93_01245, partial [bacterium]|nr:hypothetical protein [bacterium]